VSKIVVIGCGRWGKNHVRCWAELGCLYGVCDSNAGALASKSQEYGVKAYKHYLDVVKDPEVDGVVVAVPVELHHIIASKALIHGKDVLLEKPMTSTVAEATALCGFAKERNRVLLVGHILEYHPAILKLREMIRDGAIGDLHEIYSHRLNSGVVRSFENVWWSFAPHDILLMLNTVKLCKGVDPTTDPRKLVSEVTSQASYYMDRPISDSTLTFFRFANQVTGHIYVSWMHPYKVQRFVVVGDKGALEFCLTPEGERLLLHRSVTISGSNVNIKPGVVENIEFESKEPLKDECIDFLNCMVTRSRPRSSGDDGLAVIDILYRAELSAKKGILS